VVEAGSPWAARLVVVERMTRRPAHAAAPKLDPELATEHAGQEPARELKFCPAVPMPGWIRADMESTRD